MREIETSQELRSVLASNRIQSRTIGIVPTMGYLHAGHIALTEAARRENDLVVMSIFVNPTQFGANEDLDRYPRDLERDRALARAAGVDVLFVPSGEVMYPDGPGAQQVWVDPGPLALSLEGASRPGHFQGVATVVAKLFHLTAPDRAYFGRKDAQQGRIVQQMVKDLAFPVEVRVIDTVREADGLALSSRNVYLSPVERKQAIALPVALDFARSSIEAGERDPRTIERGMREILGEIAPLGRVDYVAVVDLGTLRAVEGALPDHALVALAIYFGSTRLIDNEIVHVAGGAVRFGW